MTSFHPSLSVIVPVFNERATIPKVVAAVAASLPGVSKEVIIVDDGSTDGTGEWLRQHLPDDSWSGSGVLVGGLGDLTLLPPIDRPMISLRRLHHPRNKGKGAALITGLATATGDVSVIQDADLEYDPGDWAEMYALVAERKVADVVYGSRFYGRPHRSLYFHHYIANRLISVAFNLLYNQTLSDIECGYKLFSRAVRESLRLTATDFGCEIEISAQIARAGRWRIYEMGIRYFGRTYEEGKKITWRDGVLALWYLIRFRFSRYEGEGRGVQR